MFTLSRGDLHSAASIPSERYLDPDVRFERAATNGSAALQYRERGWRRPKTGITYGAAAAPPPITTADDVVPVLIEFFNRTTPFA